jgi:hypothetical protein
MPTSNGNPLVLVDPDGKAPTVGVLVVGALVGLVNYGIVSSETGPPMTPSDAASHMGAFAAGVRLLHSVLPSPHRSVHSDTLRSKPEIRFRKLPVQKVSRFKYRQTL